ncbi:MAG: hypothetical protein V1799_10050 [bacterium]
MKNTTFLFFSFLLLTCLSCKHSTEPVTKVKDLRALSWTIDTLNGNNIDQLVLYDIWGTSASDVYAAGHASGGRCVFHYNGKSWSNVNYHIIDGGQIKGSVSLRKIFGFNSKNVFIIGSKSDYNPNPPPTFIDSSFIMNYDGVSWREMVTPGGRILTALWGASTNDIWVGGSGPTLFHYDGINWRNATIGANIDHINDIVGISPQAVYALCYKKDVGIEDTSYHSIYKWNGENWLIVDSFTLVYNQIDYKFGTAKLLFLDGKLYSCGVGIYRYTGSVWERIHYREGEKFFIDIGGTSGDNFLAVGGGGQAYHFNGRDWFRYEHLQSMGDFWAVWTDGIEVFIAGTDGWRSYVIHGK